MIPENPPDDYMQLLEAEQTVNRICREQHAEIVIRGAPGVPENTSGSHLWISPGYSHRIFSDGSDEIRFQDGAILPEQVRIGKHPAGSREHFDELLKGGG